MASLMTAKGVVDIVRTCEHLKPQREKLQAFMDDLAKRDPTATVNFLSLMEALPEDEQTAVVAALVDQAMSWTPRW